MSSRSYVCLVNRSAKKKQKTKTNAVSSSVPQHLNQSPAISLKGIVLNGSVEEEEGTGDEGRQGRKINEIGKEEPRASF